MLLPVCSTLAAWLWACSATCSTLAVSSSTLAAVSSSVEACSSAPSTSRAALRDTSPLPKPTWRATLRISFIIWLSRRLMPLNASPSSPISSRLRTSTVWLRSPSAIRRAPATMTCSGRVMARVSRMPISTPLRAASNPTTRVERRDRELVAMERVPDSARDWPVLRSSSSMRVTVSSMAMPISHSLLTESTGHGHVLLVKVGDPPAHGGDIPF